jgi:hypothetical protein
MKAPQFTAKEWFLLVLLVAMSYAFTVSQKHFVPEGLRPFAFGTVVLALLLSFFGLTKPERPMDKAKGLALVIGGFASCLILTMHVIIRFDPSYKNVIVLAVAVFVPYLAAWIHRAVAPSGKP